MNIFASSFDSSKCYFLKIDTAAANIKERLSGVICFGDNISSLLYPQQNGDLFQHELLLSYFAAIGTMC